MTWLKYIVYAVLFVYLMTAALCAVFVMLFGGPWWIALKVGLLFPFKWMRLI